jgi:YidC/Oxa1 family membrane protein insertase
MGAIFTTILLRPLYNAFIVLMSVLPWFDAGVIIIIFTILVKLALFPLSRKAVYAQMELKAIEPELKAIRDKYQDNKQEQARLTMALYKDKKINPFSSIVVILIQIPIILALYFVFLRTGFPTLNTDLLYSFAPHNLNINMNFLGLINITQKSVTLAIIAALSSFFQMRYSMPPTPKRSQGAEPSFKDDLARSMNMQMRYIYPFVVGFISYSISGVVAIYWFTSNLFTIAQEISLRRARKNKKI